LGCPVSTPINSDFSAVWIANSLIDMTTIPRPILRRWAAAAVASASLVTMLASCSLSAAGLDTAAPSTATSGVSVTSTPPAATSSVRVVVRFGDEFATATLSDSPAGREFAAMLPLRLKLNDPMGQAKSGQLLRPIDASGVAPVFDPAVGELYYSAASSTFAIFYDDLGQFIPDPGLVRLGAVDTGMDRIADAGNRFTVQISLVNHTIF